MTLINKSVTNHAPVNTNTHNITVIIGLIGIVISWGDSAHEKRKHNRFRYATNILFLTIHINLSGESTTKILTIYYTMTTPAHIQEQSSLSHRPDMTREGE